MAGCLRTASAVRLLPVLPLTLPAAVQGQFNYTTTKCTFTGYVDPGGGVTISSTVNGLPVTSIGHDGWDPKAIPYCDLASATRQRSTGERLIAATKSGERRSAFPG